jgi:hypothetical protein
VPFVSISADGHRLFPAVNGHPLNSSASAALAGFPAFGEGRETVDNQP